MAKVIKYSKEVLSNYLNSLKNKIYIYFYDLTPLLFNDAISKISKLTIKINTINKKGNALLILCEIKSENVHALIDILDDMDIGEFEIFEYDSDYNIEISGFYCAQDSKVKSIYVNKDEVVIQLYNV